MKNDKKPVGAITIEKQEEMKEALSSDRCFVTLNHALSKTPISQVTFDPSSLPSVDPSFSIEVKTMSVANQKASGRCWIFAGLNLLREIVAKKLGVKEFELSQNYISLFDKIEKANFALESLLSLADKEPTERVYTFILDCPTSDGGQWDMFVNLVLKYGLMPKSCFPETYQSENTREGNQLVNQRIRQFAAISHRLVREGKAEEARKEKEKAMEDIYRFYLAVYGVPPKTFDFTYVDSKEKYHIEKGLTPLSFYEKYVGDEINQYQSLINSPTSDKPFGRNYTVDYLGNVIEGKKINHLNLTMERMKEAIIAELKEGRPVWFGSDVGLYGGKDVFAWDDASRDYESPFGFSPEFEKEDMLDFRGSAMNHAMLITGVDIQDGVPTRWKIENSWGKDAGQKGYYVMSSSWFDRFVYQAVVRKKFLSPSEVAATLKEPIHLNP
ncbi:MAG: C1 family peptidase, partial [Bacilli bacterium]|nr:C1 family peptidase [Bacilli bacterium]